MKLKKMEWKDVFYSLKVMEIIKFSPTKFVKLKRKDEATFVS